MNHQKTKDMTFIGLMSAVICIIAPFSIPLPITAVPISFTNLALYITIYVIGWKKTTISYSIYLLLGFIGLPVFSKFQSGIGILGGPTGGYLIGFFFVTILTGMIIEKSGSKRMIHILGILVGLFFTYLLGTFWFSYVTGNSFYQGFTLAVFPFLIGDAIKIVIAVIIGPIIKRRVSLIN